MKAEEISFNVARYGGLCLLLGALSWGQATSSKAGPATQKPTPALSAPKTTAPNQSQQADTEGVGLDAPVITINGLCANPPADKAAVFNCKTVITRAQFERLIDAGQPNMPVRARREFATRYSNALVMAEKAAQMGLDKGESFEEQMKLARIQILSQELKKAIQREASQISDKDVEDYYYKNMASFEQIEMEKVYVPKTPETPAFSDKRNDSDEQKRSQQAEQLMKDLAEKLHARAIAGEDFQKLQTDAYQVAGIKADANSSMGKIRRISLPPSQVWLMDLKPGEISRVIADSNGYLIYKAKTKGSLSLDQARGEISGIVRSLRIQEKMQVIQESATPTLNEIYFRPPPMPH
jgi:hypothetical protein